MAKISWSGRVVAVQPRIRLLRSFDQRSHSYLGYNLTLSGRMGEEAGRRFTVALGPAAYQKHQFQVGDEVSGQAEAVADPRLESAGYYKVSRLKRTAAGAGSAEEPPPWQGPAPTLEVYRERGHRRLAARTYSTKCESCIWGCRMPVEIIVDQWQPGKKRYRFEAFCYGPKSCRYYQAGPIRTVPGRKGMVWAEEEWVDEDMTAHRAWDD